METHAVLYVQDMLLPRMCRAVAMPKHKGTVPSSRTRNYAVVQYRTAQYSTVRALVTQYSDLNACDGRGVPSEDTTRRTDGTKVLYPSAPGISHPLHGATLRKNTTTASLSLCFRGTEV